MIERLLFNWIDAEPRGASISCKHDLAALPRPHKAQTPLAFMQLAVSRANVALDAAVVQKVPIAAWLAGKRLIHAACSLSLLKLDMVIKWRPSKMQAGLNR